MRPRHGVQHFAQSAIRKAIHGMIRWRKFANVGSIYFVSTVLLFSHKKYNLEYEAATAWQCATNTHRNMHSFSSLEGNASLTTNDETAKLLTELAQIMAVFDFSQQEPWGSSHLTLLSSRLWHPSNLPCRRWNVLLCIFCKIVTFTNASRVTL